MHQMYRKMALSVGKPQIGKHTKIRQNLRVPPKNCETISLPTQAVIDSVALAFPWAMERSMPTDVMLVFELTIEAKKADVTNGVHSGIFKKAVAALLVWYDAFAEAKLAAIQAQKQRARLGE